MGLYQFLRRPIHFNHPSFFIVCLSYTSRNNLKYRFRLPVLIEEVSQMVNEINMGRWLLRRIMLRQGFTEMEVAEALTEEKD